MAERGGDAGDLEPGSVDHTGTHAAARDVRFRPAAAMPIWLVGRVGNRAPVRRAARHDGYFIGLDRPEDLDEETIGLAEVRRIVESGTEVAPLGCADE